MSGRTYKFCLVAVMVVCLFGASRIQWALTRDRDALDLNRFTELKGAPPVLVLTTVALGGFRGLISNALWMRASELQEQDKFFEMVQLADWITKLEPHFPQVWVMEAWNMAFNISVKFNKPEDRWRWVKRGMELLRDEGLRYNEYDIDIHFELAWLFYFKMGANMDDAHMYYKTAWAQEMETVFGYKRPNWDELLNPQTEEARHRVDLLVNTYKMRPELMKKVDEEYGPLEWRLPETHAIYWACAGLEAAQKNERRVNPDNFIKLRRVIYQSLPLAFRRGHLLLVRQDHSEALKGLGPNLDIIKQANDAYLQVIKEEEARYHDDIMSAHRYFLLDAVYFCGIYNRTADANRWYNYLAQTYPDKCVLFSDTNSLPGRTPLATYLEGRAAEEFADLGQDKTQAAIYAFEHDYLMFKLEEEDDRAIGVDLEARQLYRNYLAKVGASGGDAQSRLHIQSPDEVRKEVGKEMLNGELPPGETRMLAGILGVTNLPPVQVETNLPSTQPDTNKTK